MHVSQAAFSCDCIKLQNHGLLARRHTLTHSHSCNLPQIWRNHPQAKKATRYAFFCLPCYFSLPCYPYYSNSLPITFGVLWLDQGPKRRVILSHIPGTCYTHMGHGSKRFKLSKGVCVDTNSIYIYKYICRRTYIIRRPRPWPRQGRRLGPPQVWNFSFLAFQGRLPALKNHRLNIPLACFILQPTGTPRPHINGFLWASKPAVCQPLNP